MSAYSHRRRQREAETGSDLSGTCRRLDQIQEEVEGHENKEDSRHVLADLVCDYDG